MQPAPCRLPVDGVHGPSAWRPLRSPFALSPLLLLFEGESGLSLRRLVDGARGRLLCCSAFRLAGGLRWPGAAKIGGQLSMLTEGSGGSDGAPEHHARLRHGRSDDVRIN